MPPQNLRFVVANDPVQFRDRSTLTSNRSHIMHNHLMGRRHRQSVEDSRAQKQGHGSRASSTQHPLDSSSSEHVMSSSDALSIYRRIDDPKPRKQRSPVSTSDTVQANTGRSLPAPVPGSHSISDKHLIPPASSGAALESQQFSSLLCCRTEMYIPILNELYVTQQSEASNDMDHTMGAHGHGTRPLINVQILRYCCRPILIDESSKFGADKWDSGQRALQHSVSVFRFASEGGPRGRLALMGALSLASPEVVADGAYGVNAEATELLQEGFQDKEVVYLDSTCCAITFLVLRAMLSLDHDLARIHDEGLLRLMHLRGGLYELCAQLARAILWCVASFPDLFWLR